MVAISLYRGSLHRVPDVPRRWQIPTPTISLKDFKLLLRRRSRALSRLNSVLATSNPKPNLEQEEGVVLNGGDNLGGDPRVEVNQEDGGCDGGNSTVKVVDKTEISVEERRVILEVESNQKDGDVASTEEKIVVLPNQYVEISNKEDATNDKGKRKKEVEDKLKILNEKKHNLVQMLKQILSAEEELKRRMNVEGMNARPPLPLQVDTLNDLGSMTRIVTPRMGSEGNLGGVMEAGEADDTLNSSIPSRHLARMNSVSPSSDSPNRRSAYNPIPHPSSTMSGAACSPSRFAPTGQQGNPTNLPTVSVSGTSYIASSPSPAASGGTSVFRDVRLPSPWN